jgi:Protein kinase domain.
MHTILLFHRDIRWSNVLRSSESNWFLIDFGDSSTIPTKAVPNFNPKDRHPNLFRDNHGAEVDNFAVGKLIMPFGFVSEDFKHLARSMIEGRLTAKEALKEPGVDESSK